MKKYFFLAALLLALVLGAPAVIGVKAEARYQLVIDRIHQSGLSVESHDYERGWFGSTATTGIVFTVPEGSSATVVKPDTRRLILRSRISHGPLVSTGLGLAEIDSEVEFGDKAIFPPDYPAEFHTLVDLNGKGETRVNLPALKISGLVEKENLDFGGISGQIEFDTAHGDMEIRLLLKSLGVSNGGQSLVEVGETQLNTDSRTGVSGLMLGDASFQVNRLMLSDRESGDQLVMHELAIDLESSEESEQVSAVASYSLGRVEAGDDVYGPGLVRVEFSRISGPVLVRLQQAVAEIEGQKMSEAQRGMALLGVVMNLGSDLLKNDPAIAIKPLRLVTPDGAVQGELSLRGDGLSLTDVSNIPVLVSKLVADLSLRMPEKLFRRMLIQQTRLKVERQIAAMIDQGGEPPELDAGKLQQLVEKQVDGQLVQLVSQKIVERDGDDLATVASLSSGILTVNGKSIPLPW